MQRMMLFKIIPIIALIMLMVASCEPENNDTPSEQNIIPQTPGHDPYASIDAEVVSTADIPDIELKMLSSTYHVEILSGTDTHYRVTESSVFVRYLIPSDDFERDHLCSSIELKNHHVDQQAVLKDSHGVYVIISDDPFAGEAVRSKLELDPIESVKLTSFSGFGEGEITQEYYWTDEFFERIAGEFHVELAANLWQKINAYESPNSYVTINYYQPDPQTEIEDLVSALTAYYGTSDVLLVYNDIVISILYTDQETRETICRMLSVPPPKPSGPNQFKVNFIAIPVSSLNPRHLAELIPVATRNHLSTLELQIIDREISFGGSLPIFTNNGSTRSTIDPECVITPIDDSISWIKPEAARERNEIHVVSLKLDVRTGYVNDTPPDSLLPYVTATDVWPVGSESAQSTLNEALTGLDGAGGLAKIHAIVNWVGSNIALHNEPGAFRTDFDTALQNGMGSGWTRSDIFITLARTKGFPCRQTAGIVYGNSETYSGDYIWSQVWVEDEHRWIDVDTMTNTVGVNAYYIPIWGTRDGNISFLYRTLPVPMRAG